MSEKIVEIKNLVKRYGDLLALDHFNLEINQGEIFGLLGPNGSGKTTTINCLLSLLSFDKGEIKLFGENYFRKSSRWGVNTSTRMPASRAVQPWGTLEGK